MPVKQKFIDLILRGKDMFSPAANSASDELKKLQAESKATSEQLRSLEQQQNQIYRAQGLELYAKNAETALKAAREEVTRLAREMDSAEKPTKEQGEALKLATRSANQLQTEYNKLQGQLTRTKSELQQNGIDTRNLSAEQDRLQREVKESNTALNDKREKLRQLRGDLETTEKSTGKFGGTITDLTKRLVAFAGAYVGLRAIKNAIVDIFQAGDQFERLQIQMTGVMGSIEEGEKAAAWIQEFAKKTPLQLSEVTEAFVKLRNFGLDPMDGTLAKIIDMSEKLGGGWQKAEAISRALGEAWGKQKLQGQEILQLINAGVPVWELLEKVTGRNAAEVRKLSEAGKLGRDVMRDLIDEIGRSAEGQAQMGMKTMTGLISNLKDNITRLYVQIADSGALDALKEQLAKVNEQFERMASDGSLQRASQQISDFLAGIVKNTGEGLNSAIANVGSFITFLTITSNSIRIFFNGISAALFMTAGAFTGTISWMTSTLSNFARAVGATDIANSLKLQAEAIWAVRNAYWQQFNQDSEDIATAWNNITTALTESSNAATAAITTNAQAQAAATDQIMSKEQQRIAQQQRLEAAVNNAGIVTLQSLKNIEQSSREAYETIKAAAEAGELTAYEVEQAFNAWADAALKVAAATKTAVPETLRAEAANRGLTHQLDELIKKQGIHQELTTRQARGFSLIQNEINKTKSSIQLYRNILFDAKASTEAKAVATIKLYEAGLLLKGQYETLAKLEKLRTANYFQLRQEYDTAQRSLDELNRNYTSGIITTEQYNQQLERQLMLIQALRGLLPDVNDNTDRNTDTQRNAGQQIQQTTTAIRDQKDSLDELSDSTETATRYTSLLAGAQQALQQQFDFTDKSTEDLNARYSELTDWINQNRRAHNEWWRELARASNAAFTREQQIISETKKMRDYIAQLNSASVSMRDVTRISQDLTYNFQQMGDLELAPLRQAITDAERRLLSFRDELQGTVSSLQDELDRLNNNQSAIEKRRYEQQTTELREKLKAAQQSGDKAAVASAQEALRLAEQIYSIKQQQAAEDLKTKNELSRQQPAGAANNVSPLVRPAATAPAPVVTPASSVAPSSRTVRLVLDLQGRSYNAEMSQNEADRLLAQIERARSTSL